MACGESESLDLLYHIFYLITFIGFLSHCHSYFIFIRISGRKKGRYYGRVFTSEKKKKKKSSRTGKKLRNAGRNVDLLMPRSIFSPVSPQVYQWIKQGNVGRPGI